MGDDEDVAKLLKAVCFDKEVNDMENGQDTYVAVSYTHLDVYKRQDYNKT